MRSNITKTLHQYSFESLREFSAWLADTPANWRCDASRSYRATSTWDLQCGYDGAIDLARKGWIEGAARVQSKIAKLNLKQAFPKERNDFYGYRPNVPRYCAGAPDNMVRHDKQTGGGQALSLYVTVNTPGTSRAKYMANWGVAIAQYVKQLELEGVPCEIFTLNAVELRGVTQYTTIKIKSAGQPLDLAVLAFAIGHPAMLRRLCFAMYERGKAPQCVSYGKPLDGKIDNILDARPNGVIINGMKRVNDIATTPERALEALTKEIDSKRKG